VFRLGSITSTRQFSAIKTNKEFKAARTNGTPKSTLTDTKYCLGLLNSWVRYRRSENGDAINSIMELNKLDLNILEVSIS